MSNNTTQLAAIIVLCSVAAAGSVDKTIKFWDMRTGQATRTITLN